MLAALLVIAHDFEGVPHDVFTVLVVLESGLPGVLGVLLMTVIRSFACYATAVVCAPSQRVFPLTFVRPVAKCSIAGRCRWSSQAISREARFLSTLVHWEVRHALFGATALYVAKLCASTIDDVPECGKSLNWTIKPATKTHI